MKPTMCELIINLETVTALGLNVPPTCSPLPTKAPSPRLRGEG